MMPLIFRLYRAAQYSQLTRHPSALRALSKFPKINLATFDRGDGGKIFLRGTDVEVTTPKNKFLLVGSELVRNLKEGADAEFSAHPEGVLLHVRGVKLLLQHWEELFIAEEIFVQGVYNFQTPAPFVLIDVGMNVGTTSLFFANQSNCQAIHGFELFPKTAEKAKKNMALNSELSGKIHFVTKGLAPKPYRAEMDYVEEWKGSVGIFGLPDYVTPSNNSVEKISVEFISCVDTVSSIARQHPGQTIVCKLDCEGAEYGILEALDESGQMQKISALMIEWHRKGAAPIEAILRKNGFHAMSFSPNASTHGMIYAWRC